MHHVIYIPGLNDQSPKNKLLVKLIPILWNRYNVITHVFSPFWSKDTNFDLKLKQITNLIDSLARENNFVYLIGQSAGGAAALNAFVARKNKIAGVISIDGRLREGINVFPSLDMASIGNPAFKDSVLLFENINEKKLTKEDRKKIMIIHPLWDNIVPISTATLLGTTQITMPIITHMLGGAMACTLYAKKMIDFLKQSN
jgi:predicted peptidase